MCSDKRGDGWREKKIWRPRKEKEGIEKKKKREK
jgi:hypothetical protein